MKILYSELVLAQVCDESIKIDDTFYFQSFYGQAQEYQKFLNKDLDYNELLSDLGLDPAKAASLYSQK